MKKNKKIYALVLAIVLVAMFSVTAFASLSAVDGVKDLGVDIINTFILLAAGMAAVNELRKQKWVAMGIIILAAVGLTQYLKNPAIFDPLVNQILNIIK